MGYFMDELFSLIMGPKQRVKEFNQIFTTIIDKFKKNIEPV
jgi:hypothetical protein